MRIPLGFGLVLGVLFASSARQVARAAGEGSPTPARESVALAPGAPVTYAPFYPERWSERQTSTKLVPWTGSNLVFLTTSPEFDPEVMGRFVQRLDGGWQLYQELAARAPSLFKQIDGLPTIAAVPGFEYTCGYGCGYVGATGIEAGAFYGHDYPILANDPAAVPHYYFYEMGRNFYTFGDRHSLFTTGYAVFMRYVCLDTLACPDPDVATRQTIESAIDLYAKSPMGFLEGFTTLGGLDEKAPRLKDPNGRPIQPSDQPVIYASAMLRLHRDCGGNEWLGRFFRHLAACPEVPPESPDAGLRQGLNWLIAASCAARRDLTPVFVDQWRLPLPASSRQALAWVDWTAPGLKTQEVLDRLEATKGFALSPYVQALSPESVAILWRTGQPAYGWVEFGENDALEQRRDSVVHGLRTANVTEHRVVLTGLQPAQIYTYRVGFKPILSFGPYKVDFGPEQHSSPSGFRLLPAPADTVTAVIFNDLHNGPATFQAMRRVLDGSGFDLSIFNGDCLADLDSIEAALHPFAAFLGGVQAEERPAFFLRGNHETRGAFARDLPQLLAWPDGHPYFAFSAGPVRFLVLDCGEDKPDAHPAYSGLNDFDTFRREETEWLKAELASPAFREAPWRVLISHIPIDRSPPCQQLWTELLAAADIDLAIHGHTHRFAFHPAGTAGTPYPIAIGGGPDMDRATVMVLNADSSRLGLTVRNAQGEAVYPAFEKKQDPPRADPEWSDARAIRLVRERTACFPCAELAGKP